MMALVLIPCVSAFALLMLAMARHQQEWLRRKLAGRTSRTLRFGGFLLLALAFVVAGASFGWGYGTVVWAGSASAGAAVTVIANINRDRVLRKVRREK